MTPLLLVPVLLQPSRDVSAIIAEYRRFFTAASRADAKGVLAVTTPDFTQTQRRGQVLKRGQVEVAYRALFKSFPQPKWDWKVSTVRVTGNSATSTLTYTMTARTVDSKGKAHSVLIVGAERHAWQRQANVWRLRSASVTKEDVRVDGKKLG